jgi:threonine dehydratase
MSANYQSTKPDGYLSTRNNVYLEREKVQEVRTFKEQGACRNLPEQSKENYGKKSYK